MYVLTLGLACGPVNTVHIATCSVSSRHCGKGGGAKWCMQ